MPALSSSMGTKLLEQTQSQAPDASGDALRHALAARSCAIDRGEARADARLAVIDFSRASTLPRLWIFEFNQKPQLLYTEHVAHGRGSGEDVPTQFSNVEGSHQSSLGLFRAAETYVGANGYSLRLDGLEAGINDRARERAIVMHGAPYVDPVTAALQGRLGRSFGCPALRPVVAREVINTLRDGQLLFAYYPDADWLNTSMYQNCTDGAGRTTLAASGPGSLGREVPDERSSAGAAQNTGPRALAQ